MIDNFINKKIYPRAYERLLEEDLRKNPVKRKCNSGLIYDSENRALYSSSGQVYQEGDISCLPFIGSGLNGSIFYLGNGQVIKVFRTVREECKYSTMEKIRHLQLPNFYKIYELLSQYRDFKACVGYVASYHQKQEINILDMPTEWLIENYEGLREAVTKLGEECILIHDVNPPNSIINNSGITIVDADFFVNCSSNQVDDNIGRLNEKFLNPLLDKYCSCYYPEIHSSLMFEEVLEEIAPKAQTSENKLAKILSRYPKPIDYFKDRINN